MRMRKVLSTPSCLVCLLVVVALTASGCFSDARVRSAEESLKKTVTTLPVPNNATLLGETSIIGALDCGPAALREQLGTCCAYASYLQAFGTEVPSELALDQYSKQLEAMGWQVASRTNNSRFLERGNNEAMDLATYPMSGWYASELDPDNRRAEFPTVLHLRLFTALPQRDGC
jgi:hypothetical protein